MRLDDYRYSDNVSEGRGGGGLGGGGFGGGGGLFGLLFGLVLSRFGIGGVLILALGYCALSSLGGLGGGTGTGVVAPGQQSAARGDRSTQEICAVDPTRSFSC
jgi:predicted metalloprotease